MSTASEMVAAYLAAESALLSGKTARIGDRLLQMEDLAEIRKGRAEWERRLGNEQASALSVPRFSGISYVVARLDGS